ncbi:peptidase C19, ubiquitin carboxyl-terminal hydrolase 2, partial [Coemansia reversa NRRL 1564]
CGLNNLGNTCFMNSALQCLGHFNDFTQYFVSNVYTTELNRENPLGMKGAVATAYGRLVQAMWDIGSGAYAPRGFKQTVAQWAPQFRGYNQQDAHEFLAFFLDGMHEDLNRIVHKPYIEVPDADGRADAEVADEQWEIYKRRNDSVVVDLFQGQYRSTLVCPECSHVSVTFDPFMYLTLPMPVQRQKWIERKITLEDCLAEFTRPEQLGEEDPWYCSKCKEHQRATKKFDLWRVPEILVVHLKRFEHSRAWRDKIDAFVDFPLRGLDLSRTVVGPNGRELMYDLHSVCNHFGGMGGGHYTAYALSPEDAKWYDFNDSHVSEVSDSESVKSAAAYMLFYR